MVDALPNKTKAGRGAVGNPAGRYERFTSQMVDDGWLNLADDEPFALVTVWVRADVGADVSRADVERSPFYDLLPLRGVELGSVHQTITAELKVANQPERHVALPRRGLRDCLSEELRRLDADDVYAEVLTKGIALVAKYAAEAPATATRATVTATIPRRPAARG